MARQNHYTYGYGFMQRDDREQIYVPAGFLSNHPLIGFGQPYPTKRREEAADACSPMMAWFVLGSACFVKIMYDYAAGSPTPVVFDYVGPVGVVKDPALAWNWLAPDTRSFIRELRAAELITQPLADALESKIGHRVFCPKPTKKKRTLTPKVRASVLAKTNGKCTYCGVGLTTVRDKPNSYHADHVFPASSGATDDPGLLVPACATCNQEKGAKTISEYIAWKKIRVDVPGTRLASPRPPEHNAETREEEDHE